MSPVAANALLAPACLLFVACAGIPQAPADIHRKELEVEVRVDPTVETLLRQPIDRDALQRAVSNTILSMADVGLRFYPVPSDRYEGEDPRPEYVLTVEVLAIRAEIDESLVRSANEIRSSESAVEGIDCTTLVTFERRRQQGPPLLVGQARAVGGASVREASASLTSEPLFALESGPASLPLAFTASDLEAAVQKAVRTGLKTLVEPIDRELARY